MMIRILKDNISASTKVRVEESYTTGTTQRQWRVFGLLEQLSQRLTVRWPGEYELHSSSEMSRSTKRY
jgi:hypothetical protein